MTGKRELGNGGDQGRDAGHLLQVTQDHVKARKKTPGAGQGKKTKQSKNKNKKQKNKNKNKKQKEERILLKMIAG